MADQDLPLMLTIENCAGFLQVSTKSVRNYIARGQLKAIQPGGRLLRVRREDFLKFLGEPVAAAQPGDAA